MNKRPENIDNNLMRSSRIGINSKDITGNRYGRLVALAPTDKRNQSSDGKRTIGGVIWKCQCDCGNISYHSVGQLNIGSTKSCGCLQEENRIKFGGKLQKGEAAFNQLFDKYKRSAQKRQLSFGLSKEEFKSLTKQDCHYCGLPPMKMKEGEKQGFYGYYVYNGVDRKDNNEGYTLDNCVSCCETCNRAKLKMGINEFLNWVCRVYSHSAMLEYT